LKNLSLLFIEADLVVPAKLSEPAYFHDLNLDQIISHIIHGREEYKLDQYFYGLNKNLEQIQYRQEIMKDMEKEKHYKTILPFTKNLSDMRNTLDRIENLYCPLQQQRGYLELALRYQKNLEDFLEKLKSEQFQSAGLKELINQLMIILGSSKFIEFKNKTVNLFESLKKISYCVFISETKVSVRCCEEDDYAVEVAKNLYLSDVPLGDDNIVDNQTFDLNHVEAQILEGVAKLYPEPFAQLDTYCKQYMRPLEADEAAYPSDSLRATRYPFMDHNILIWERELQFYLAYLEYIAPLKHLGLAFSIPDMAINKKQVRAEQTFDLALATRLLEEAGQKLVVNDLSLANDEQILVITGPNQGGKTTFARTFGQLHHLAGLGCPVPGLNTQLCFCDAIYTHFSYREDIRAGHGKLEEDLIRIHENLKAATASSIFIMNELFDSTTYDDALYLSEQIIRKLLANKIVTVWVTFIDALTLISPQIVSLMSMVNTDDLTHRTFEICRKPADGLAYALSLAEKYGLTYTLLMEKIDE
jgi:hypothetical protein